MQNKQKYYVILSMGLITVGMGIYMLLSAMTPKLAPPVEMPPAEPDQQWAKY